MFQIDITAPVEAFSREISAIERQNIPFVTAFALTKTGQDIKEAETKAMESAFDRPTRFTLNALQLVPATKQTLRAEVKFKEGFGSIPAQRYLGPEVEGGGRVHKSHERALIRAGVMLSGEYAVPSKFAPLDSHGNLKGSVITRILSDVQANPDPLSNSTRKTRTARRRRGGGTYFALRRNGTAPGIYFRLGLRDLRPIILFVRAPSYTKRLPFYEVATDVAAKRMPTHFAEGWARFGHQRKGMR
jgi:hypothetical protein